MQHKNGEDMSDLDLLCTRKTFMVHQTFVRWALCILFKFVKSLIRHLGLTIGNVRCVRWFSWTLDLRHKILHIAQLPPAKYGVLFLHITKKNGCIILSSSVEEYDLQISRSHCGDLNSWLINLKFGDCHIVTSLPQSTGCRLLHW